MRNELLHGKQKGKGGSSDRFPLLGLQNHSWQWLQLWNQKTIASWQESNEKPRQCVEKQSYYSANKGLYSQGYGLPSGHVQLWELDHKKGRVPKNWCLWTVVLEKTSENPLDAKRSNQSILREINPEYSLEGLMLKLQYFGHLMWRDDSLEKSLMLGKIEGRKKRGRQRRDGSTTSPVQWTWTWANSGRWWGTGRPGVLQSNGSQGTEQQEQLELSNLVSFISSIILVEV